MIRITVTLQDDDGDYIDFVFLTSASGRISFPIEGTEAAQSMQTHPLLANKAAMQLDEMFPGKFRWSSSPVQWVA